MKCKYSIIDKKQAIDWYNVANIFANSLNSFDFALKEYNNLSLSNKKRIREYFINYDKKIKKDTYCNQYMFYIDIMVEAHILATEFDIDPLTVLLCINSPCKLNEKIIIK